MVRVSPHRQPAHQHATRCDSKLSRESRLSTNSCPWACPSVPSQSVPPSFAVPLRNSQTPPFYRKTSQRFIQATKSIVAYSLFRRREYPAQRTGDEKPKNKVGC